MAYIDPKILDFATDRQREHATALDACGSFSKAAEHLGINQRTLEKSIAALRRRAAIQGCAPDYQMTKQVPEPYYVKGISTLYNREGELIGQWIKSDVNRQNFINSIHEGVQAFIESVGPVQIPDAPESYDTDIIPWIEIGDAHFGMLAHAPETGENFDLKIAEKEICSAIALLINQTGSHERCVINDLGDFTHYENFSATTEASGHSLDFDTRFPRMIKSYSRVMRFIIDYALSKFKFVDVIINQGNHSRTNDIWMAELLRVAYGDTGRVTILNNDNVFIPYRMGNTFVMTHHSDKCKPARLAHVMSTDYAKDWGEAKYRYIDVGHVHHNMARTEHPGVIIESFNILAPRDKWAHEAGYRSRQSITVIDRSKTYGEVGRRTLPIQMVRDNILKKFSTQIEKRSASGVFTV